MIIWIISRCPVCCPSDRRVVAADSLARPGEPALCSGCAELWTLRVDRGFRSPTAGEEFAFYMAGGEALEDWAVAQLVRPDETCPGK